MPATLQVRRSSARVSSVEFLDKGDYRPLWLSADGLTVWCSNAKQLVKSLDDMETFSAPIWTLPATGTSTAIHAVRETADGFLLVACFKLQGNYAGLWRVNPGTGAATEVLTPSEQAPWVSSRTGWPSVAGTTGTRSNYFTGWFGFHCYGDGTVIINEYGIQANGTSIAGARYVFMSRDNGQTWVLIRDMWAGPPMTTVGNTLPFGSATWHDHMHGAFYDPYTGNVWTTAGDNGHHTEVGNINSGAWPDPGNASGTWVTTPASQTQYGGSGGQQGSTQCVTPWVFPSGRVLIGTDGPIDGLIGYDNQATAFVAHDLALPHSTALQYTGAGPFARDILSYAPGYAPRYPVLFPFYVGSGTGAVRSAVICAADPTGKRIHDIWTDTLSIANPYGCYHAIGPTAAGKILGAINVDGRAASQNGVGYVNMTVLRADMPVIV